MAKKRKGSGGAVVRSAAPVIVVPSSGSPAKRAPSRGKGVRRRSSKRGGFKSGAIMKAALEEKLAVASIGGAGIIGYLEGSGHLTFVPDFGGIGRVPTLALGTYIAGRVMKSQKLRHAGIGLAAAAAFAFGVEHGAKK